MQNLGNILYAQLEARSASRVAQASYKAAIAPTSRAPTPAAPACSLLPALPVDFALALALAVLLDPAAVPVNTVVDLVPDAVPDEVEFP